MNLLGEVTYLFSFVCAYVFFAGRGGGGGAGGRRIKVIHIWPLKQKRHAWVKAAFIPGLS